MARRFAGIPPINLWTAESNYADAAWVKNNVTVEPHAEGNLILASTEDNTLKEVRQSIQLHPGHPFTAEWEVKPYEDTTFIMCIGNSGGFGNGRLSYNLQTGNEGIRNQGGGSSIINANITPIDNGFFRIRATWLSIGNVLGHLAWIFVPEVNSARTVSWAAPAGTGVIMRRARFRAGM